MKSITLREVFEWMRELPLNAPVVIGVNGRVYKHVNAAWMETDDNGKAVAFHIKMETDQ